MVHRTPAPRRLGTLQDHTRSSGHQRTVEPAGKLESAIANHISVPGWPSNDRDTPLTPRTSQPASATGKVTLRHNSHLYKIGIGRAHARTPIITIITGLDIRIINHTTGQLL